MELDNISSVLYLYVRELNIRVTRTGIIKELETHPDNTSLLAISDVLNYLNVPNACYKIGFEEMINIPMPFIAYVSNKDFVMVNRLDKTQVTITDHQDKSKVISTGEFINIYSGSVLIAEKDTNSGEEEYVKNRKKEFINKWRVPFVLLASTLIVLSFLFLHSSYLNSLDVQIILLTVFKTAGLLTSVMLLMQSINENNPLIQKICTAGKSNDCNAILSSKAAKMTDELSWSEVGFFYFAGSWLLLLFNSEHIGIIQILALINIISLPYSFYSIYYQWRIAKQWCIFCCTVQAILWLEFFSFLPYVTQGVRFPELKDWISVVITMAIPVIGWIFIKPFLLEAADKTTLWHQLRHFKYNTELFNKLLLQNKKYELLSDERSLVIGNREAEQVITIVSNPYCHPCSKLHKKIDKWLDNREDIKLQFIFSTHPHRQNKITRTARYLMSLQTLGDDHLLKGALSSWYGQKQKNLASWAAAYPLNEQVDHSIIETQRKWCKAAEVTYTPVIFINGRKLPNIYQIEDIKYFV